MVDTGVFLKYFNGDPNVRKLIESNKEEIFTLEPNLAELIYLVGRALGKDTGLLRESVIRNTFTVISLTKEVTRVAGENKIKYPTLSLVDSYVLAAGIIYKSRIFTTDRSLVDASRKESIDASLA